MIKVFSIIVAAHLFIHSVKLMHYCAEGFYKTDPSTEQVSLQFRLTIDDWGTIFIGNELKATEYIGNVDGSKMFTFDFQLGVDSYLYVIAYSNWAGGQFFYGQLDQIFKGQKQSFYTQSPAWQVSATGRFNQRPVSNSQSSFDELNTQIELSELGLTPSGGWKTPAFGPNNWIWYSANGDPDPTTPGYNHQEYLIFRIRAGYSYPKICYVCPKRFYCPENSVTPLRCPKYTATLKRGQYSQGQCVQFEYSRYLNLNQSQIESYNSSSSLQYYLVRSLPFETSQLFIKVACDPNFSQRMQNLQCENQTSFTLTLELSQCVNQQKLSQNINVNQQEVISGTYIQVNIPYDQCQSSVLKSPLKIENIYTQKILTQYQGSVGYVVAGKAKENHYRFYLNDDYNIAPDDLRFGEFTSTGITLNYSPNIDSKNGNAEGDTFNFDEMYLNQRFTKISLTEYPDYLYVNDSTWNNYQSNEPQFLLGSGNDSIQCYSPCTIYGGPGIDTFQMKGTRMTIKDFSSEDIIDLRTTHSYIKHQIHLTSQKPNQTTLIINLSQSESIVLSPFSGELEQVHILFDAPSCYLICNNCTTESQCDQCSDCSNCNTTHCVACNSTYFLKEGRCVEECGENYLPNPEQPKECIYCNIANCNGCPFANQCTLCEDNYIPNRKGECEKCNVTFYSIQGDSKCSKCGLGCDYCNKTNCFQCSVGFLFAPRLSQQICYQDLAVGQNLDTQSQIQTTKTQSSLINGGMYVNSDGSVNQIETIQQSSQSQMKFSLIQFANLINEDNSNLFYKLDSTSSTSTTNSYNRRLLQSKQACTVGSYAQSFTRSTSTCSTKGIQGLTQQILNELNLMGIKFSKIENIADIICKDGCTGEIIEPALISLKSIVKKQNKAITITSTWRSIGQQALLYFWKNNDFACQKKGVDSLKIPENLSNPKKLNHLGGNAIDINDPLKWKDVLTSNGWKYPYPDTDNVHFEYAQQQDLNYYKKMNIIAFQRLWNKYNPLSKISEDGVYGDQTEKALFNSPCNGWNLQLNVDSKVSIYDIPLIKQNDQRWSNKPYGLDKKIALGKVGSLISCHSMILSACGTQINSKTPNPGVVLDWLNQNNGYDQQNNLASKSLDVFSLKFVSKVTDINSILSYFRNNINIVFLNVKRQYQNGLFYPRQHWVLMVGEDSAGALVKDPLWDISYDAYDKIVSANIYQLSSSCSLAKYKTEVNLDTYQNVFIKQNLNYQSCLSYSKLSESSKHYKDSQYLKSWKSNQSFKTLTKIASYSNLVQIKFSKDPSQASPCSQGSYAWKTQQEYFGVKSQDVQSFADAGSQICSFAMLLETMQIQDEFGKNYNPLSIEEVLLRYDAYIQRDVQIKKGNTIQTLKTKNRINFQMVSYLRLFGLPSDIIEISSGSLTQQQNQDLQKNFKTGKYNFIFEIQNTNGVGSYFVFSLNEYGESYDNFNAFDPVQSLKTQYSFQQIIGYVRISKRGTFQGEQLNVAHSFLSGQPHYHAILTYKQSNKIDGQKLPAKTFYLIQWQRQQETLLYQEQFTVIDMNSDQPSQELVVSPVQTFNQQQYILDKIDIFQNKDFLIDTTQYVTDQVCTDQQILAFVRMNQQSYLDQNLKSLQCFDQSGLIGCPQSICSPNFCRQNANQRIDSLTSKYSGLLSLIPFDSHACALLKYSYYIDTLDEKTLMPLLKQRAFQQLTYSLLKPNQAFCTKLRPRQLQELFMGFYYGKSPKSVEPISFASKTDVLQKLIQTVSQGTQAQGQDQYMIGQAICSVIGGETSCTEKLSKKMTTQEFGLWLEGRGYLRSDLQIQDALPGDIIVFSGNYNYPFGHGAVRGNSGNIWYSDYTQSNGPSIYQYSSYIIYN